MIRRLEEKDVYKRQVMDSAYADSGVASVSGGAGMRITCVNLVFSI